MVSNQVSTSMRERLSAVCSKVKVVNVLDSGDSANLAVLARPELGITFTKLHCWTFTEYSKCVFLDADTLVVRNCDELFEREELSAAPDAGWPDCFNSGVFVFKPSLETYSNLVKFAVSHGSFDGGDQGLLNSYFKDWATKDIARHLPFVYNMTATAVYSYRPAYNQYGSEVRIVHFIGSTKPWQVPNSSSFQTSAPSEHVGLWWDLFEKKVRPALSEEMTKEREIETPVVHPIRHVTGVLGVAQPSCITPPIPYQSEEEEQVEYLTEIETLKRDDGEEVQPDESVHDEPPPRTMTLTTLVQVLSSGYDWLASEQKEELEKEEEKEEAHSTTSTQEQSEPAVSTGVAAHLAQMDLAAEASASATVADVVSSEEQTRQRREAWERGEIDYNGKDSFDNIMKKIQDTIRQQSPTRP